MNLFAHLPDEPLTHTPLTLSVYTDGGSRGNPGISGCGGVLYNAQKKEVGTFSAFLGTQTNNYAEYKGLIIGLQEAQKLKATQVHIFMDSKLAIEQMSGNWKVKHPKIKPLFEEAKAIEAAFQNVTYNHVLRHLNTRADEMANLAMDRRS